MSAPPYAADIVAIRSARARIAGHAHVTPVLTSRTLDEIAGARLFLKCENLQRVGAFKIRGALSAVLRLPNHVAARGVVTHSSGNHAQAIALAARTRGIPAHVVMPTSAPKVKRDAVIGYGARVIPCEPTLAARDSTAAIVVAETGGTLIPPFDHPDVIAGQGTIGLELLDQISQGFDAVIAPVGGGGLIAGIALALRSAAPQVKVIAAEPAGANDAARSKASGERMTNASTNTIADGLLTSLGAMTWPVVRDLVERVVTVEDDAIIAAMRLLFERTKLVVEPSGAVSVAAALSGTLRSHGIQRAAVVISGGNVDLDRLPWIGATG